MQNIENKRTRELTEEELTSLRQQVRLTRCLELGCCQGQAVLLTCMWSNTSYQMLQIMLKSLINHCI